MGNPKQLTDKQEILLSKYFDDECNFYDRYRVYRLLESHPQATLYLDDLAYARELVRTSVTPMPVSLWTRISSRLHQEEKSRLRTVRFQVKDLLPSFFTYGVSGAAVAALVFIIAPSVKINKLNQVVSNSARSFMGGGTTEQRSSGIVPVAMQVDWMRSNGRVTVMSNDSGKGGPVIFIKRRQNQLAAKPRIPLGERNSNGIVLQSRNQ